MTTKTIPKTTKTSKRAKRKPTKFQYRSRKYDILEDICRAWNRAVDSPLDWDKKLVLRITRDLRNERITIRQARQQLWSL